MKPVVKSAMLALALMTAAVTITACAKYPVVSDTRAEAPAPVSESETDSESSR